jgi:tetratricopeptide (TPR) repeat protein
MISMNAVRALVFAGTAVVVPLTAFAAGNGNTPGAIHCLATVAADPPAAVAESQALSQGGDTIGSRHCLGDALVAQGEVSRGARILDDLARETSKARDVPAEVQGAIWGDAGRAWLEADDVPKALAALNSAIALRPQDMQLRVDRAVAFGSARRFWEAIDDLNAAISNGVETAEAYLLRATAWREVGTTELAADDIDRAAQKAPNDPGVLLERGRIRKLTNDIDGARRDFLAVVKIAPGSEAGTVARQELGTLTGPRRR